MTVSESQISCGVDEIFELPLGSDIKDFLRDILDWYGCVEQKPSPFLIFSDVVGCRGDLLYKRINEEKLGSVTKSVSAVNPNSENRIVVYVWKVNWRNFKRYVRE